MRFRPRRISYTLDALDALAGQRERCTFENIELLKSCDGSTITPLSLDYVKSDNANIREVRREHAPGLVLVYAATEYD